MIVLPPKPATTIWPTATLSAISGDGVAGEGVDAVGLGGAAVTEGVFDTGAPEPQPASTMAPMTGTRARRVRVQFTHP